MPVDQHLEENYFDNIGSFSTSPPLITKIKGLMFNQTLIIILILLCVKYYFMFKI